MATELATRPPAFVDGKTLSGNDLRLNVLSGSGGATPLQSRGGVRPSGGDPGLVAALTTPVMKVRVNAGIADVPSTSVTGGFYRVSWDQVDLDIDVSSALARTDLIIVEVVDTGTSAATGKVRVLKGTSGAGRPTNAVVNAHWFTLAAVAVRVNAEGTGNIRPQDVTPEIPYAVAPGGLAPVANATERGTLTPYPSLQVLEQSTARRMWHDGTRWRYEGDRVTVTSTAARDALSAYEGLCAEVTTAGTTAGEHLYTGGAWVHRSVAARTWVTPTLNSGYTPSGLAGWPVPQYRLDSPDTVRLRGGLATSAAGTAFTLPVGYRPSVNAGIYARNASFTNGIWLEIQTDGDVTVTTTSGVYLLFDGTFAL